MEHCLAYRGYRGTINFSEELQCFYGKIDDITLLVCYEGDTRSSLRDSFEMAVDEYLLNCARMGRKPERPYPRLAC